MSRICGCDYETSREDVGVAGGQRENMQTQCLLENHLSNGFPVQKIPTVKIPREVMKRLIFAMA